MIFFLIELVTISDFAIRMNCSASVDITVESDTIVSFDVEGSVAVVSISRSKGIRGSISVKCDD